MHVETGLLTLPTLAGSIKPDIENSIAYIAAGETTTGSNKTFNNLIISCLNMIFVIIANV